MPLRFASLCFIAVVLLHVSAADSYAQRDYPTLAPYSKITWEGEQPTVEIDGKAFRLLAIDDTPVADIVVYCKRRYRDQWQRRFNEDLVEVLSRIGKEPGKTVNLTLESVEHNQKVTLKDVAMTEENRKKIRYARLDANTEDRPLPKRISKKEAAEDIDALIEWLENEYAYLKRKPSFDWRGELNAIKDKLEDENSVKRFAVDLSCVLAKFGDGHTRIRSKTEWLPSGYLPFVIENLNGKLVALKYNRRDVYEDGYPYLKKIDGIDAEEWVAAAGKMAADGSPQFHRIASIGLAHFVRLTHYMLGKDGERDFEIVLANNNGEETTKSVSMTEDAPQIWPASRQTTVSNMEGRFGYMRIAEMVDDRETLHSLTVAMGEFSKSTEGLIIDVRGNPGGSRTVLRTLFPLIMTAQDEPRILNVAAYRLQKGDAADKQDGYLDDRELWPASSRTWPPYKKKAIEKFAKDFNPEWKLPKGEFSDWHYMLATSLPGMSSRAYTKPIVVLMDEYCFSATDVFLGAFKGFRGVTLIGRPSGGGSGRAMQHRLPNSRLPVKISTMASFQPNGKLYDGNGIQPDIVVEKTMDDITGEGDSMIEAAINHLNKAAAGS